MRAAPDGPEPQDHRGAERLQLLGELHGEVMVCLPMAVKEIGRGGALIETGFPLQLNSLHEVRLTLGDRPVVVKGRVAYCTVCDVDQESVLYRSGIEFVEPSERVAAAIGEFIGEVKDGRRAT